MAAMMTTLSEENNPAALVPINARYAWLLAGAASFGGLMFGFDVAIITGAGPFIEKYFSLDPASLGIAFSALLFGCVVGSAIAGAVADWFGRRIILIAVAILFAATTVATGLATSFNGFLIARFLGGIAVGGVSLVAPLYVAESAPASLRGRLGALYQMAIVTGVLGSYIINYILKDTGSDAWRMMFYTGVIPAAIFLVLMAVAPESPRYLFKSGRSEKAIDILERLSGKAQAALEAEAIINSINQGKPGWSRFTEPRVSKPLIIGFWIAILIHLCGINTIVDYAPTIFKSAGFALDAALLSTLVIGGALFSFTFFSFWIIDRFGRRPLYIYGSIGMGVALMGLVVAALIGHFSGPVVLVLLIVYLLFFSSCIGPVFWTLVPEILPNDVRSSAMIVPVLTQWVANAVVVLYFPHVFATVGQAATFGMLAMACFVQAIFTVLFVQETKNRSLEDIATQWRKS